MQGMIEGGDRQGMSPPACLGSQPLQGSVREAPVTGRAEGQDRELIQPCQTAHGKWSDRGPRLPVPSPETDTTDRGRGGYLHLELILGDKIGRRQLEQPKTSRNSAPPASSAQALC